MGYTYPEFNNLDMSNANAVRAAIAQQVNQLYGGPVNTFSTLAAKPQQLSAESSSSASPQASAHATGGHSKSREVSEVPRSHDDGTPQTKLAAAGGGHESKEFREWSARVRVKKYEVGGSFKVLFFLGSVPENPRVWSTDSHFVGAFHGFVNSTAERCANCRRQREVVLEGFVHLDEGIARLSNLNSFEPSVVEPYLKHNLHWRVQKTSGEVVDLSEVPSLEIAVSSTRLTLPPGEIFPVPDEPHYHHGITHGRPGGLSHENAPA
jgi:tyrosinase